MHLTVTAIPPCLILLTAIIPAAFPELSLEKYSSPAVENSACKASLVLLVMQKYLLRVGEVQTRMDVGVEGDGGF